MITPSSVGLLFFCFDFILTINTSFLVDPVNPPLVQVDHKYNVVSEARHPMHCRHRYDEAE